MTRFLLSAAALSCALLAGCQKAEAPAAGAAMVTEAEATKLADSMVDTWQSMDGAKIKSLYAPGVVAFDYVYGPLEVDRTTFDKAQDAFAAARFDSEKQVSRNIQLLDADTFIVSGVWDATSKALPASNGPVRCTDVFHKDSASGWAIVNEHCSPMPKTA